MTDLELLDEAGEEARQKAVVEAHHTIDRLYGGRAQCAEIKAVAKQQGFFAKTQKDALEWLKNLATMDSKTREFLIEQATAAAEPPRKRARKGA